MDPKAFSAAAETHLPEALRILRRLVEVNSFTTNGDGVAKVARITEEIFQPLGFSAEFIPCATAGGGPHVLLCKTGPGDPIVLVTHSDTVFPPEEEAAEDFHWDERPGEGRIYGPGTIDNKGGTVLIWLMLRVLHDLAPEVLESASWMVAANAAEEVTGDDFTVAVSQRCGGKARAVLVFEGGPVEDGVWHFVVSRKGRSTWRLDAVGRASHAGSKHQDGINAIDALAEAIPFITALNSIKEERTVNVGRIEGGTVVNRVPHEAVAEWECRARTPSSLEEADVAFAALAGIASNGATLSPVRTGYTTPWAGGEGTNDLFAIWKEVGTRMGLSTLAVPRGGLSDANHLWQLGPTLDGLGPLGGNAHASVRSADGAKLPEYIEPASLVPKATLNALALIRLIKDPTR